MSQKPTEPILPDVEEVKYRAIEDWRILSIEELDEAYALVPTQRQQYYREVLEREGSRVKITLKDEQWRCHRPHPGKEAKKYQVEEAREILERVGVKL